MEKPMNDFKIGDKIRIKTDYETRSYAGSYAGDEGVIVSILGEETVEVMMNDKKTYMFPKSYIVKSQMDTSDPFGIWDGLVENTNVDWLPPDIEGIAECICDERTVINFGCNCEYGKMELERERRK